MRSIFFKEGKSNFFDETWTEITEIIPFILFKKRRLAQGIRRPKAADSSVHSKIFFRIFRCVVFVFNFLFSLKGFFASQNSILR